MTYHFIVHTEDNGFWAESCELSGCVAEANTLLELKKACEESLDLYLEEPTDSKMVFPLPDSTLDTKENVLSVLIDPEIALAVLLRHYRSRSKLTQKQVSELLGMKNVYSYQRLEKKSNPTLHVIKKLHKVFPEMKLEHIF